MKEKNSGKSTTTIRFVEKRPEYDKGQHDDYHDEKSSNLLNEIQEMADKLNAAEEYIQKLNSNLSNLKTKKENALIKLTKDQVEKLCKYCRLFIILRTSN